ncbi:hypothetical protein [Streptomyces sp. NPDC017991]|uniref:hypothetical protein n=1 Tax=Streptomyces sp. NPDC017991 TaxID=3365026 RepID=UPI0037B8F620
MDAFDHKVVDGFIKTMERSGAGLATQSNAFDKVKSILLDAHRLGLYDGSPLGGVKPPQYNPAKAVIPSVAQLAQIREARRRHLPADRRSDERLRAAGCGLRNGNAAAVNLRGMVAHDVYRIFEQAVAVLLPGQPVDAHQESRRGRDP